jgi:hypothetical protein
VPSLYVRIPSATCIGKNNLVIFPQNLSSEKLIQVESVSAPQAAKDSWQLGFSADLFLQREQFTVQGFKSNWPSTVNEFHESYGYNEATVRPGLSFALYPLGAIHHRENAPAAAKLKREPLRDAYHRDLADSAVSEHRTARNQAAGHLPGR